MMSNAIQVNYTVWGLGSQPGIISTPIDEKTIKENIDTIEKIFSLSKLNFSSVSSVNYFQESNMLTATQIRA